MILVSFQDIPFETTQAKIFTKVRHSQTTLRGKKNHKEDIWKRLKAAPYQGLSDNSVHENVIQSWWSRACCKYILWIRKEQTFLFFCFKKWQTALSPFGWFLLNPSKKKQTQFKQTLSSDLRSNIYNNQMEYQINFIYYYLFLFCIFYFLQTDTTQIQSWNLSLAPLYAKLNQSSLKTI